MNNKKMQCTICGAVVNTRKEAKAHIRTHGIPTKKISKPPLKLITEDDVVKRMGKQKKEVEKVKNLPVANVGVLSGRRGVKLISAHECFVCKKMCSNVWLYKNTLKGDIKICGSCKTKLQEKSARRFPDAMLIAMRGGFGVKR